MPDNENSDNQEGHYNQNGHPWRVPSDYIALGKGEEKNQESDSDDGAANPVNMMLHADRLCGPRGWRDEKECRDSDQCRQDGEYPEDPLPVEVLSKDTSLIMFC